jgi:hypothetical protein
VSGSGRAAVLLFCLFPAAAGARDGKEGLRAEMAAAIEAARGLDVQGLDQPQKEALGKRLDEMWNVLDKNRALAREVVTHWLESEPADSLLIIDLAGYLMFEDAGPEGQARVAGYLMKADPNVYSRAFFKLVAFMSSRQCRACLPAVARILEVRDLDGYIEAHALPVKIWLGMCFTLGQYGHDALPLVLPLLTSGSCTVRSNAASVLVDLLPDAEPPELAGMALNDTCPRARRGAWTALAALRSDRIPSLLAARVTSPVLLDPEEREAMALAATVYTSKTYDTFTASLVRDLNPDQATELREIREEVAARDRMEPGSGPAALRRRVLRALKKARSTHRYEDVKLEELLSVLHPADLPLLHGARSAVLARLSDECLYEYYPMTRAAGHLRAMGR